MVYHIQKSSDTTGFIRQFNNPEDQKIQDISFMDSPQPSELTVQEPSIHLIDLMESKIEEFYKDTSRPSWMKKQVSSQTSSFEIKEEQDNFFESLYGQANTLEGTDQNDVFISFESNNSSAEGLKGSDNFVFYRDTTPVMFGNDYYRSEQPDHNNFYLKYTQGATIIGSQGNDTFYLDNSSALITGRNGNDTVILDNINFQELTMHNINLGNYFQEKDVKKVNKVVTKPISYTKPDGRINLDKFDLKDGYKEIQVYTDNGPILIDSSVENIVIGTHHYSYKNLKNLILDSKPASKDLVIYEDQGAIDTDLDQDYIPDYSHYDLVSPVTSIQNVRKILNDHTTNLSHLADPLKDILAFPQLADRIAAINYSLSLDMNYSTLNNLIREMLPPEEIPPGLEINAQNLREYIHIVKAAFKKTHYYDKGWLLDFADKVDAVAKLGVPVVISSGNARGNPNKFNLLTLSENVISTGAADQEGKLADYSINNSLVDAVFQGNFSPTLVKINNKDDKISSETFDTIQRNQYMVDINNDGLGDHPIRTLSLAQKYLSQGNRQLDPHEIEEINNKLIDISGTSLAAPNATNWAVYMSRKNIPVYLMNYIFSAASKLARNFLEMGDKIKELVRQIGKKPPPIEDHKK